MKPHRRSWLAPAVVQTSALDCGPAALASVVQGFGLASSYERLRELCHTDVDGTSIDAIEVVAQRLGLEATQVLVPEDHLLSRSTLPAIAVVRLANGLTHFCVVWRQLGPLLQIMDPARGRRWVWKRAWLRSLYRHKARVDGATFADWTASEEFRVALHQRGRKLGIHAKTMDTLQAKATAGNRLEGFRYLDAVVRLAGSLRRAGAWPRWRSSRRMERFLLDPRQLVPKHFLRAHCAPGNGEDWIVEGAVAVRFSKPTAATKARRPGQSRRISFWSRFLELLGADGKRGLFYLVLAACLAGGLLVLEVLVFRFLVAPVVKLQPADVQALLAVGIGALAALALLLEQRLIALGQRMGRLLDVGLRQQLFERLPKIKPQYFSTRLTADLASRAHSIYRLRALPGTSRQLLQIGAQVLFTGLALVWLIPSAAGLVVALLIAGFAIPIGLHAWQAEHDLAARTHAGALSRFYLASLQGLAAVRAHGAERALEREHEALLTRWGRVSHRLLRLNLGGFVVQSGICTALSAGIVIAAIQATGTTSATLLITFWALRIPPLTQAFGDVLRQLPAIETTARRTSEPLTAPVWPTATRQPATSKANPAPALELGSVRVVSGGRLLLEIPELRVQQGERVAIVGRSGAGKSTLLRALLGLVEHTSDRFEVSGLTHCPENILAIRREINWLDPDVYLYDASILENLLFGTARDTKTINQQIDTAGLSALLSRRPDGIETRIGEAGGRLSGGEGQRIRFGRALGQDGRLLLWDEAFRGLEQATRRQFLQRAFAEWPSATVLYVTHDLVEAFENFDRILVMQGGRIVQDGRPRQVFADRHGAFAQLMRFEEERAARLSDPAWQRWQIVDGKLQVEPAHGNDRQARLV